MKFRTTLILLAVFVVLLGFVLFIEKKPKPGGAGPEEKLVALAAADIQKISLKRDGETLTFKKDDKGEWLILEPIEVKADPFELDGLASTLSELRIERVVERDKPDPAKYEIPKKEVSLWVKGQEAPVRVLLGMDNPIDGTVYARKDGDPRIVLLSSALKTAMEKKLFDFRQKDVFRFETKDVQTIQLRAKDLAWTARRKDEGWFLETPLRALAKDMKINGLLDALSGLKAKEFAAEDKKPEDLKKNGLDKAEYTVTLKMPAANREIVFALHKAADKTYATTSQSTKIIVPETDILPDLDQPPAELRETKVAAFAGWQASKLAFKKGGLALTLTKAANDKWYFDAAQKDEADPAKVESLIRKIEGLESAEFVDAPKNAAEYGLDKPEAEVTVWTKDTLGEKPVEKSVTLVVGKPDKDKKAVVKNARLDYLFKVDASFLDDFPKEKKDWKAAEPDKKDAKK